MLCTNDTNNANELLFFMIKYKYPCLQSHVTLLYALLETVFVPFYGHSCTPASTANINYWYITVSNFINYYEKQSDCTMFVIMSCLLVHDTVFLFIELL